MATTIYQTGIINRMLHSDGLAFILRGRFYRVCQRWHYKFIRELLKWNVCVCVYTYTNIVSSVVFAYYWLL